MSGFRIITAVFSVLVLAGCVLTNPEFKIASGQGRSYYADPNQTNEPELNKAIQYAVKTQEDFDDWQGELTTLSNVEIWSLFGLGTASGSAAAYGAPKDVIVGLGIGLAALLGAGEITNLDKRSLVIANGHKAIQCAIDTALEMNAAAMKLTSHISNLSFRTLKVSLLDSTIGATFAGGSVNVANIMASSQAVSAQNVEFVAKFLTVQKLNVRVNQKLADARTALRSAMGNAKSKASSAATALDKTVTAIRYAVKMQVRRNAIDKSQIFDKLRKLISDRAKEIVAELEAAKKKAAAAGAAVGDVTGDGEAQNLLSQQYGQLSGQTILQDLQADVEEVEEDGDNVQSVADLLKAQLECTPV